MTRLADRWTRDPGVFKVAPDAPVKSSEEASTKQSGAKPDQTPKEAPKRG